VWPGKLTSEDSAGTLSIFELHTLPRSGQFAMFTIAKMSGTSYSQVTSYSRRETTSTTCNKVKASGSQEAFLTFWANTGDSEGKLVLACQPGGFEEFFDELGKVPADQMNASKMTEVMAKYGMKYIGPPLFGSLYKEH